MRRHSEWYSWRVEYTQTTHNEWQKCKFSTVFRPRSRTMKLVLDSRRCVCIEKRFWVRLSWEFILKERKSLLFTQTRIQLSTIHLNRSEFVVYFYGLLQPRFLWLLGCVHFVIAILVSLGDIYSDQIYRKLYTGINIWLTKMGRNER